MLSVCNEIKSFTLVNGKNDVKIQIVLDGANGSLNSYIFIYIMQYNAEVPLLLRALNCSLHFTKYFQSVLKKISKYSLVEWTVHVMTI